MKKDIHPPYQKAKVKCSCGNEFEVGATVPQINVEICSYCHPFYTGQEKFVDTAGRLEKFKQRLQKTDAIKKSRPKNEKPTKRKIKKPSRESRKIK